MKVAEKLPPLSRVCVHLSMMYRQAGVQLNFGEQSQTGAEKVICWSSGNLIGERSGYHPSLSLLLGGVISWRKREVRYFEHKHPDFLTFPQEQV